MVPNTHLMAGLLGHRDELLRLIERAFPDEQIVVQGNEISVAGPQATRITKLFDELVLLLEGGQTLDEATVLRTIDMAREDVRPSEVLGSTVMRASKGKAIRPRTAGQKRYCDSITANTITFGIGPAGTGKSYLAVALAVQALQSKQVSRIVLTRPAVEAGERLGFLPGDMREKVDPYLRPIYDALYDFMDGRTVERGMQTGMIEVAPLAFMRCRTLTASCVLLDEAQNATSMQMKMFLTRLGEGSRMIITGDPTQTDLPPGQKSGLSEAIGLLSELEGIGHVRFRAADVVRHDLVRRIVDAYEAPGREAAAARP